MSICGIAYAFANCLSLLIIHHSRENCVQFFVPRRAVRPLQQGGCLFVSADCLCIGVPIEAAAKAEREVGEMAERGDAVAAFEVGDRLLAAFDAVEKI